MAENSSDETIDLLCDEELNALVSSIDWNSEIDISIEKIPKDGNKVQCQYCPKQYASKSGLNRHVKNKHPEHPGECSSTTSTTSTSSSTTVTKSVEEIIHPLEFKKIVKQCFSILADENKNDDDNNDNNDGLYPKSVSRQFKTYEPLVDTSNCYKAVTNVILKFKGDSEKFLPDFVKIFKNGKMFDGLDHHCNVLLGFELANHVLSYLTNSKIIDDVVTFKLETTEFTEKDKQIISYLSGYVIGTFYRRLRFNKKQKGLYHQKCLSLLMACKFVEGSESDISHHKFIDLKNRGGLWKVTTRTIAIFSVAESYFRSATKEFTTKIDAKFLVSLMMKDASVLSYFSSIHQSAEEQIEKEIALNLLEDLLTLYIRVRSHSYAKDKKQEFKISKNSTKNDHFVLK